MKLSLFISLTLMVLITLNCQKDQTSMPDAIFLITLDTTRADYFDYNILDNQLTPNFAGLASKGSYFKNAYALIPITLPSHFSMFYSLPPHQLKVYNNGQVRKTSLPSLVQLLKSKNYLTAAVISLGVLKAEFGLDKGFDYYIENFRPHLWDKSAEEVNNDFFRLIKQIKNSGTQIGRKMFFWIHYSDPHEPYFPSCDDGNFSIFLNKKQVFSYRSIEQAVVKTNLSLKPGKNILVMEMEKPSAFDQYVESKIEYIKFRDFSIDLSPDNEPIKGKEIEVVPPNHWKLKTKRNEKDYYSSKLSSMLLVINKEQEEIQAQLRFIYSLHMDKETKKLFYKEEIRFMDQQFGKLLAFLKKQNLYQRSTFIIMGDHGEGLGEYRGHFGHIHFLNKGYSRVPFIIQGVGIEPKGERQELVSNLNIAPTILHLAQIKKPDFMLGQSLLKPLHTKKVLLETYSPEAYFDAFSIIDYPWQIIFYPGKSKEKLEFINLESDHLGISNLNVKPKADRLNQQARQIKSELINQILKISRIITATKGKVSKTSKRHQEILKSLGYL
jgi:arylsulfatase A-like enzyme